MRSDLHKVIVERPRPGSRYRFRRGDPLRKLVLQELPANESMKVRHHDRRCFNENLKPLQRWLGRQVGRPWNKVYSEACQVIKPTSTVKNHVKIHLLELVHRDVVFVNGKPHGVRRWLDGFSELGSGDIYVDPRNGLLRIHKRRHVQRPDLPEAARLVCEADMSEAERSNFGIRLTKGERAVRRTVLRKIAGLWHEIEEYEVYQVWPDGKPMKSLHLAPYIPFRHIRIRSRQLNRRELRKLSLTNGSPSGFSLAVRTIQN